MKVSFQFDFLYIFLLFETDRLINIAARIIKIFKNQVFQPGDIKKIKTHQALLTQEVSSMIKRIWTKLFED